MCVQRFDVWVVAGPRGHALIVVPFDPDAEWGVKAVHHVSGTVNGCRVRVTLEPGDSGWGFTMNPARMQHAGIEVGSQVPVELSPEGPQRGDLAEDVAAALEASPAAGAFFDALGQFYRKGTCVTSTPRRDGGPVGRSGPGHSSTATEAVYPVSVPITLSAFLARRRSITPAPVLITGRNSCRYTVSVVR